MTRRDVLLGAGGLATAWVFGAPVTGARAEAQLASGEPATRKLKVIVAGGHPGDPEYGCGGTVARLTNLGHQVVLMYLNNGEWPPTAAAIRIAEATKACELLKATPAYAGQINGHAVVDNAHYEEYAKLIDAEKPDAVLTQWPIDNHRDHRAITMLNYDAWRQSKELCSLLLRSLRWGRYIAILSHALRRYYRDGTAQACCLLCACQPDPRSILRIARSGSSVSRCRRRLQASGSVCPPAAKPRGSLTGCYAALDRRPFGPPSLSTTNDGCPGSPEFPVKLGGFRALHAPFLKERRTRGFVHGSVQEIRGISLVFREMWDTTGLDLKC